MPKEETERESILFKGSNLSLSASFVVFIAKRRSFLSGVSLFPTCPARSTSCVG
jgi:hypothetical protein